MKSSRRRMAQPPRRGRTPFALAVALLAASVSIPPGVAAADGDDQSLPSAPPVAIIVTAPRMDIPLKENPAATTVVQGEQLASLPKTIGAEEALKLVPGVKVDNQADGERVHMSIRGQGILTETGIRGIKVLLDGLPLNDPTGFAPDLFDVDWATVKRIEVFRGPASALYGGGASGGILDIETRDGGSGAASGEVSVSGGSNGFWKMLTEVGGTDGSMNYRVSGSRMELDGYRVHTAADATNVYGKFRFALGQGDRLTVIVAGTEFFNQNAEGLNTQQAYQDPRQPNPDALTFNEYQRTHRATVGLSGRIGVTASSEVTFAGYMRATQWKESVPSSVDHRDIQSPGGFLQYTLKSPLDPMTNSLSIGVDLDYQKFNEYQRPNLGNAHEGTTILSDQDVHQRGEGFYLLDRLELTPQWSVMAGVRYDSIDNSLDDNLVTPALDLSGRKSFSRTTARVGVAWNPIPSFGAYVSWAQGFLPPSTHELSANPDGFGGFNGHLVPATSRGGEAGVRGEVSNTFTYDVAIFHILTENDFGRYRVQARPLETFYNNAGASRRYGGEVLLGFFPSPEFSMELAYTYSHFLYDHALYNGVTYYDTRLPSSPEHQATLDTEYRITPSLMVGVSAETWTRAYVDPSNAVWVGGYTLLGARVAYKTRVAGVETELLLSGRNLGGKRYIAFAEPDPDGNSYHPGPER
ncbi:MAG: TonB-dependent receptor, partial [Acidobacteriia bacterium]|nr:TonB-dependent receptor [Terriglobia bacterium]